MSILKDPHPIMPSLLDRLLDFEVNSYEYSNDKSTTVLKEVKDKVLRDVENLLNTRRVLNANLDKYPEIKSSILNYGLPDFSHMDFDMDVNKSKFQIAIKSIIEMFEPRLKNIHVEMLPMGEDYERTFYIHITSILLLEPEPIPMVFDSRLRPSDRYLKLREVKHG